MRYKKLTVVCGAADQEGIYEDSGCVEFVLGNLHTKDTCPVLRKRAGNIWFMIP